MHTFIFFNTLFDFLFVNTIFFFIALFGVVFYSSNFIRFLINIEVMILLSNLNFVVISFILDDVLGQIFVVFVLAVAAAESAIGLSIFILYYRIIKSISIYSI